MSKTFAFFLLAVVSAIYCSIMGDRIAWAILMAAVCIIGGLSEDRA